MPAPLIIWVYSLDKVKGSGYYIYIKQTTAPNGQENRKMNAVEKEMHRRLDNGLDPLTGEKMETVGEIRVTNSGIVDETGKSVKLNERGTWVYC